jgi:hypothetical protein
VITADPDNQTFDAIVTKDHAAGERNPAHDLADAGSQRGR